jgi:hypothetical protein
MSSWRRTASSGRLFSPVPCGLVTCFSGSRRGFALPGDLDVILADAHTCKHAASGCLQGYVSDVTGNGDSLALVPESRLEHERLDRVVGLDGVVAEERQHLAAGQSLDDLDRIVA